MATRNKARTFTLRKTGHTEAEGRTIALRMMNKIAVCQTDDELWPWSISAMYRPIGYKQHNFLLLHLAALQKTGSEELLAGFCSVVTDYMGHNLCAGGSMTDGYYEKLTERDITGRPGPWPRMEDDDKPIDVKPETLGQWREPIATKLCATDPAREKFQRFMDAVMVKVSWKPSKAEIARAKRMFGPKPGRPRHA